MKVRFICTFIFKQIKLSLKRNVLQGTRFETEATANQEMAHFSHLLYFRKYHHCILKNRCM